jgi:hypothetical protein
MLVFSHPPATANFGGIMKLSDKTCKAAKSKEKLYKLADGGGLYLEVMPNGSNAGG